MKYHKIVTINTAELNQVLGARGICECWGTGTVLETLFGHNKKPMNNFRECEKWCSETMGGRFWVFQDSHGQTWISQSAAHFLPTQPPRYPTDDKYS